MGNENCTAILTVDEALRQALERLGGEAYAIETTYQCDLVVDQHEGPHYAVAQGPEDPQSDVEVWIRWSEDLSPELVELPNCEAEQKDEVCVLFDKHRGPHTSGDSVWT